ncbi:MAG: cytochrome c oxidase assembly protein [bacterium]
MTVAQTPALRWTDWPIDPLVVTGLLAATVAWRWITLRFAARRGQTFYGWGALVVLALSLLSPLEAGAGRSFTLHMTQHVVLMMVVAPLLALGTPAAFLGWLRRRPVVGPLIKVIWSPLPAFALYHAALFLWHLPSLYDAALRREAVHLLQHATFLGGSLAFWGVVVAPEPRIVGATMGHRLVMVLGANILGWVLAFALTLAERPLYLTYAAPEGLWGMSPLLDLRLGGAVMWVVGNILYGVVLLLLLVALLNREQRQSAQENPESPGNLPAST